MQRSDISILVLRIVFGVFLSWHGVNKVRNGIDGTAGWFGSIGMKWPRAQAWTAAVTEIGAGALFAAGFLTPIAAAGIIGTMIVAIVTVHWRVGFFIFLPNGGWEYCASIAVVAAAVAWSGAGDASVDGWLGTTEGSAWGATGVLLGLAGAVAHLAFSWRRPEVQK